MENAKCKVKVCGITNLPDALAAIDAGCDALGFVFYKRSPRYIAPGKAKEIINCLPPQVIKIGVFVNSKEAEIKNIANSCGLDILQFHGDESAEFCDSFPGFKIIKAFRIRRKQDLENISRYKTFACLFDTHDKKKFGGTGKRFNWGLLEDIKFKRPVFLSGGLNARNVRKAIQLLKPEWVDVSSFLEKSPGKKDHKKLKCFVRQAKGK